MSEFTECLKDAFAVACEQFGTTATIGSTSVTGVLSTITRRENLELHGYDLDLNATFTVALDRLAAVPAIGSTGQFNSVTYRIVSIDTNPGCYVIGLREA
ncbi:MAG: hypothetical protein EBZ78_06180 [Verrucomicrobia bacterium]|nr:hypothetical protein [Verrucomicrobiota bacterium]